MEIGRGYYSVERLQARAASTFKRLDKLGKMIVKAKQLEAARAQLRSSRFQERNQKIKALRAKGLKLSEIGGLFGLTKNRVSQIVSNGS